MTKPSDKSANDNQKISTVSNPIECKKKGCKKWALCFSQFCWKHMPENEKANYKKKIEECHRKGNSLEKFILEDAHLVKAEISYANLSGAFLMGADLRRASLMGANLEGANLFMSRLSGSDIEYANLSEANLYGASVSGARLREANLSKAELREASFLKSNLYNANLSGAFLEASFLDNSILTWADLSNVNGLSMSCFTERLSDIEKTNPQDYKESYKFIKNYFLRNGLYDDSIEAAYREKVLQRLSFFQIYKREAEWRYKNSKKVEWRTQKTLLEKVLLTIKYIILNPRLFVKPFLKTFSSLIWSALCGYGEKAWRPVVAALVVILAYGLLYWYADMLMPKPQSFWDYTYFSIVSFTTLGYGDLKPLDFCYVCRLVAASEAFIGAFMIALFVWTLARRGAAR